MPTNTQNNYLLEQLPNSVCKQILQHCDLIELNFGEVIAEQNQPYKQVYFPQTAFISLMKTITGHPPIEVGLIGNEGMLGASLVLGITEVPCHAVVQGTGTAYSMPVQDFKRALSKHPSLLKAINRYQYVAIVQIAQTVACTRFHEVEARLARWLLLTHDRAHGDQFHLTHQYLSDMLGVQRSAVSIAAGTLQRLNLISYVRGKINILDHDGLEGMSCECYTAASRDYARQFS